MSSHLATTRVPFSLSIYLLRQRKRLKGERARSVRPPSDTDLYCWAEGRRSRRRWTISRGNKSSIYILREIFSFLRSLPKKVFLGIYPISHNGHPVTVGSVIETDSQSARKAVREVRSSFTPSGIFLLETS